MKHLKFIGIIMIGLLIFASCDRTEVTPPCRVYGYVYIEDSAPPIPIESVRVSLSSPYRETYTNNSGYFEMYVEYGSINFHFYKSGYHGRDPLVELTEDEPEVELIVYLTPRDYENE